MNLLDKSKIGLRVSNRHAATMNKKMCSVDDTFFRFASGHRSNLLLLLIALGNSSVAAAIGRRRSCVRVNCEGQAIAFSTFCKL